MTSTRILPTWVMVPSYQSGFDGRPTTLATSPPRAETDGAWTVDSHGDEERPHSTRSAARTSRRTSSILRLDVAKRQAVRRQVQGERPDHTIPSHRSHGSNLTKSNPHSASRQGKWSGEPEEWRIQRRAGCNLPAGCVAMTADQAHGNPADRDGQAGQAQPIAPSRIPGRAVVERDLRRSARPRRSWGAGRGSRRCRRPARRSRC